MLGKKRTTDPLSSLTFHRTADIPATSWQTRVIWLIGLKLHFPNLNNAGDSYSSSGHGVIHSRRLHTCSSELSLKATLRSFASKKQIFSTAPQISNNISILANTDILSKVESSVSINITSKSSCSIKMLIPAAKEKLRCVKCGHLTKPCLQTIVKATFGAGIATKSMFTTQAKWKFGPCTTSVVN